MPRTQVDERSVSYLSFVNAVVNENVCLSLNANLNLAAKVFLIN